MYLFGVRWRGRKTYMLPGQAGLVGLEVLDFSLSACGLLIVHLSQLVRCE